MACLSPLYTTQNPRNQPHGNFYAFSIHCGVNLGETVVILNGERVKVAMRLLSSVWGCV